MERRFQVRLEELLNDARVPPSVFGDALPRLEVFLRPFVAVLQRSEQRDNTHQYVQGLLSDLGQQERRVHRLPARPGTPGLAEVHRPVPLGPPALLTELARQVGAELGEPDGVLVFDPSAFPKKGTDVGRRAAAVVRPAGQGRQLPGRRLPRPTSSRHEHALVDVRLYLPKEWAKDKRRRQEAGVPREVRFRTRHELALEMLDERGPLLPHAWVAGDDEMGRCSWFRQELRLAARALPAGRAVEHAGARPVAPEPPYAGRGRRPQVPFTRVDRWCAARAGGRPGRRSRSGDGEKGPLVVQAVRTLVQARTEGRVSDVAEVLVVFRERQGDGTWKHDYLLSNAPLATPLAEFARVFKW